MRKTGFWTASSGRYKHSSVDVVPRLEIVSPSADTYWRQTSPTTNRDSETLFRVGDIAVGADVNRSWMIPDFSSLEAGLTFAITSLFITPVGDNSSNARTLYVHRCLRAVISTGATYNTYNGVTSWGTAGCRNSTTDYDGAVVMGSATIPASPTINSPIEIPLVASEFQKLYDGTYTNRGIVLFVGTEANDAISYASIENATAAYRPYFAVTCF